MPRTTRTPRHATRDLLSIYRDLRNTNEPSRYSQIDSNGEGVRLVHLAPGDFDDSIVMHVVPHNLTADAQTKTYDALSCAWGTDLASSMAYLDGIPVTITANLDCALRHLRLTMVTRTLWIDAVSINQADTRERNHQVQIMGKIYSAARKVLIWLGPVDQSDYHLRAILGAMQFQFSDGNTSTVTLFDYMCSVISLMIEQNPIIKNTKDCVLDTLHRLVDRPWFHRIWVVQELALSRTVAVHIGSYTFPWQPFEHFANWLPNHKVDPKAHPELTEALLRVARFPRQSGLPSLFCRTIHLSTTDPRDKVFGILGMARFQSVTIKPDYTKPAQEVFAEAASAMLQEGHLAMYLHAPLHPLRKIPALEPLPNLPSWVPDFRIAGAAYTGAAWLPEEGLMHGQTYHRPLTVLWPTRAPSISIEGVLNHMHAWLPFPPIIITKDRKTLFAPGILIGTIEETSGSLLSRPAASHLQSGLPHDIYHFYCSVVKPRGVNVYSFVQAITAPFAKIAGYDVKIAQALFDPYRTMMNTSTRAWGKMQDMCAEIIENTYTRYIFVTADKVGSVYHPDLKNAIHPGDHVVGLFGVNLPFILRQNNDHTYQMINVARLVHHKWGHDFLWNTAEMVFQPYSGLDENKAAKLSSDWADYEAHGLKEYAIV